MIRQPFREISLKDPFFATFKADYAEFGEWFDRKSTEQAWVMYQDGRIVAFLYTKVENGPVLDVDPPRMAARRLKIGSMKADPHGTRLGERLLKKALDEAIQAHVDEVYVTIFAKHEKLVNLLLRYGFVKAGRKSTDNGVEWVLTKDLRHVSGDILQDYPRMLVRDRSAYLLSVYPEYHTRLFPDSMLSTDPFDIVQDTSYTNSIHKAYVCQMDVSRLQRGDILVIYRTTDRQGPARYRSVATSICVVENIAAKEDFADIHTLETYCAGYTVFSPADLQNWFRKRSFFVIRMTYNAALSRRPTRDVLIRKVGLNPDHYWGFLPLQVDQLFAIAEEGRLVASLIVH